MLTRDEIQMGLPAELESFGDLVRPLSASAWAQPSRCDGWTVADLAAHVVGGLADVVAFRLDGAGSPEWTARQVEERRGRTPTDIADELDGVRKIVVDLLAAFDDEAWNGPAPAGVAGTLGAGVEALWYDAYVHGDDIRAAIGAQPVRTPGLRASVHHVAGVLADRGWGPAVLALDGMDAVPVGADGARITGDALAFVLAATGRGDPGALGLGPDVNIYA